MISRIDELKVLVGYNNQGFIVTDVLGRYVIAERNGKYGREFVVWNWGTYHDSNNNLQPSFCWGHYFSTRAEAVDDIKGRA